MKEMLCTFQHQVNIERVATLLGIQSEARFPEHNEVLTLTTALKAPAAIDVIEVHDRKFVGLIDDAAWIIKRVVVIGFRANCTYLVLFRFSQLRFIIEV